MADMGQSTAVMDSEACDEDESANWDPFEDAHKFEALAEKQEQERKKQIQDQFNTISAQNKEEALQ